MNIFTGYFVLFSIAWIYMIVYMIHSLTKITFFHKEIEHLAKTTTKFPKLSIIIPACNEAEHIATAMHSLLSQDYPNFEIIVINDRSSDETGQLLDQLAMSDARLQVLHIQKLPRGWLGKVNALHQGVQLAKGDWYLFTDADVHFKSGLLKKAFLYIQAHNIGHLALLPQVKLNHFWLNLSVRAFGLLFLFTTRAAAVNNPNSKTPIGVGAFNLVQAELFKRTPGFEWLRLEPGDDIGLGIMLKNAGARTHFAFADQDLSVPWYANIKQMFKGLEKNLFGPGAHYLWWRLLIQVFVLWALITAPWSALIFGITNASWLGLVTGTTAISTHLLLTAFFLKEKPADALSIMLFPVGILLVSFMMLWSGYRCLKNGGIDWRGTHYSLQELRTRQRVKF